MAALASNLEGDVVGGVALDLESAGREVVEVLVQQLHEQANTQDRDPKVSMWSLHNRQWGYEWMDIGR